MFLSCSRMQRLFRLIAKVLTQSSPRSRRVRFQIRSLRFARCGEFVELMAKFYSWSMVGVSAIRLADGRIVTRIALPNASDVIGIENHLNLRAKRIYAS